MEHSREFLISKEAPKELTTDEMLRQVILEDIGYFGPEVSPIIERYADGTPLNAEETKKLNIARDDWWKAKFNSPLGSKSSRRLELQKYLGLTEQARLDREKTLALEKELTESIQKSGLQNLDGLKTKYIAEYPEQLEGVMAFFGMIETLRESQSLEAGIKFQNREEKMRFFISFTENNFTLTHFILSNSEDEVFLEKFWATLRECAMALGKEFADDYKNRKRGILTQVAVYKLVSELGAKTSLSHPEVDAMNAIDVWMEDTALQIKSSHEAKKPEIRPTDTISFPGISESGESKRTRHFNSRQALELNRFRTRLNEYNQTTGQHITGYMITVPDSMIDHTNGEPSKELITFMRFEMARLEQPIQPAKAA